jgi:hypothetical protein
MVLRRSVKESVKLVAKGRGGYCNRRKAIKVSAWLIRIRLVFSHLL